MWVDEHGVAQTVALPKPKVLVLAVVAHLGGARLGWAAGRGGGAGGGVLGRDGGVGVRLTNERLAPRRAPRLLAFTGRHPSTDRRWRDQLQIRTFCTVVGSCRTSPGGDESVS